jgi:hypothetical protein
MADDGYNRITSIDYSPVAVQRLQQLYPGYDGQLAYAVADARSMPQYGDAVFAGVLDKGTLDALLCGDTEATDVAALLGEVWRLLQPGAAYVMITSGEFCVLICCCSVCLLAAVDRLLGSRCGCAALKTVAATKFWRGLGLRVVSGQVMLKCCTVGVNVNVNEFCI